MQKESTLLRVLLTYTCTAEVDTTSWMEQKHAFLKIAELHAQYGTTSMLPTTLSASREELLNTLAAYETANPKNVNGAQFLGMHLEGPYFAMTQRGAQDPRYISDPDPEEYKEVLSRKFFYQTMECSPGIKRSH